MATRQLAIYALVISSTVLSGCESIEAPSRAGRVALNVIVSTGACGPLHSGRVEIRGPTERTVTIAPGATDTIGNLLPGAYTVGLEGLFSGEVDCFGQSAGVQVVAGQTTTAAVTLASFVSSVTQVVQSPGTKSFTVNVGPVASAASYEVEAATDSAFTDNHVVQPSTQTSAVVTVPASGPYLVRVRARDPYDALGRPSASQLFTVTCDCWTAKAAMPTPRRQLGVGVVNGVVYAVGGYDGTYLATVEAYDPATNTWTSRTSMPTPRSQLAVGVVNGVLYAVGGFNGSYLTTVEAYDPVTNTWTSKAPMPTPRGALAVGVVNNMLYAVGGEDFAPGALAKVEAYDPVSNTWTAKAAMPTPSGNLALGVVNDVLYAVGGYNTAYLSTVQAYDPVTNTWTDQAKMSTSRNGLAVGVANGVLYAVGGFNGSVNLSAVAAYAPVTDTWTSKAAMPTPRRELAVGVANGVLYAVGGFNGGAYLSTVEAYDP